ncbi:GntR family transcriptional regulator [Tianweitania sp. BSSL-BM11]|uniref:GntR family transcriptional regulator n=1 Tax=Tianweitania aestuarii TaxID=2814886 RepID=A0ABS5RXQ6_9HYPH|nr:GntR family transcriptional regulator [Tianweitania aestuarii]MBS9721813.1 GntR family transcriptional regulator [Tianweitania aestuarii]
MRLKHVGGLKNETQENRGDRVYRTLVERIRTGQLLSGARLREEDIASVLGVSRTPVREAFARLQVRGLVQPGASGLTVASLDRSQVIELYALRARLEGSAAAFAAENASSGELAGLTHIASLFEQQRSDPATAARINALFHESIYEAAHNRYLRRMLGDLNDSLALLPSTTFSVEGRSEAALVEHQVMLDLILNRDAAGAEAAARAHIDQALRARLTLLFSSGGSASEA